MTGVTGGTAHRAIVDGRDVSCVGDVGLRGSDSLGGRGRQVLARYGEGAPRRAVAWEFGVGVRVIGRGPSVRAGSTCLPIGRGVFMHRRWGVAGRFGRAAEPRRAEVPTTECSFQARGVVWSSQLAGHCGQPRGPGEAGVGVCGSRLAVRGALPARAGRFTAGSLAWGARPRRPVCDRARPAADIGSGPLQGG